MLSVNFVTVHSAYFYLASSMNPAVVGNPGQTYGAASPLSGGRAFPLLRLQTLWWSALGIPRFHFLCKTAKIDPILMSSVEVVLKYFFIVKWDDGCGTVLNNSLLRFRHSGRQIFDSMLTLFMLTTILVKSRLGTLSLVSWNCCTFPSVLQVFYRSDIWYTSLWLGKLGHYFLCFDLKKI